MRKKIFAILMSAMMMVSFMPAMAFATPDWDHLDGSVDSTVYGKWTVTNVAKSVVSGNAATFVYDGQSHEVNWNSFKENNKAVEKVKSYSYSYWTTADFGAAKATVTVKKTAAAPVAKEAGYYQITAYVDKYVNDKWVSDAEFEFGLWITQRPVLMLAKSTALDKTKVYDGKKFAVTDDDFTFSQVYDFENHVYDKNSGLIAGDTIITKAMEYGPEVGTYVTLLSVLDTNSNYYVTGFKFSNYTLKITKATPTVKVTSNTLTIKRGKSKAVKFSANLGTAKLTKLSGNAKINLKNGKLYVKKGLKKGTYKVKVKAAVAESNNWFAASRTKTLTVKVK